MPSTKLYFKVIHNNVLMAKEEKTMIYSNVTTKPNGGQFFK